MAKLERYAGINSRNEKSIVTTDQVEGGETAHLDEIQGRHVMKTTPIVVLFSLVIGLGGWLLNFDMGYAGAVLQMPAFKASFGTCQSETNLETGVTSLVCTMSAVRQSLPNVSSLFIGLGSGFSGFTATYLGRRGNIQLGCIIVAIGAAAIMGTEGNLAAYIACKSVGSFGLGLLFSTTVPYGIECLPPHRRGTLTALFNVGLALGSTAVAGVCLGSSTLSSAWSWKAPIICQIPISIIYSITISFFPESPRWLVAQGRDEAARQAFLTLYKKHMTPETAGALVLEVKHNIEHDRELSSSANWIEIFHRRYIVRLLTACFIVVAGILCGAFFIALYGPIFFAQISGIGNPLAIHLIIATCAIPGALVGPFVVENLGRRRGSLYGYFLLGSYMLIIGITYSSLGEKSRAMQVTLVTFICLWQATFNAFIASTTWIISAELHSVRLRTYGQAFVMGVVFIFQFGNAFWTPYMISAQYGNMGVNIVYYFFGLTVVIWFLVFISVPETGILSLEQIDDLQSRGTRAWTTSLKQNKLASGK